MEFSSQIFAVLVAAGVAVLTAWSESRHARRCRAAASLAFGPVGPRRWTRAAPYLQVVGAGLLAWGLTTLASLPPELIADSAGDGLEPPKPEELQRVIILLDVSPSMNIVDAGPKRDRQRRERVLDVTEGICSRIALGRTRFSVIAFFTSARPVVVDTSDIGVIRNVLDNLPLVWSFEPGDTNLLEGIRSAGEMARDWPPSSTTLLICTDGDTVDFSKAPTLPRSIHKVDVLAVGDPVVGTFINNHDSRQQAGILRRLAAELGGSYYDINTRHVPSSALAELAFTPPKPAGLGLRLQDFALIAVALGAIVLAALPLALEYWGSAWRAERELPSVSQELVR